MPSSTWNCHPHSGSQRNVPSWGGGTYNIWHLKIEESFARKNSAQRIAEGRIWLIWWTEIVESIWRVGSNTGGVMRDKRWCGGEESHRCVLLSHMSPTLKTTENHKGIFNGLIDVWDSQGRWHCQDDLMKLPCLPYKIQPYDANPFLGRKRESQGKGFLSWASRKDLNKPTGWSSLSSVNYCVLSMPWFAYLSNYGDELTVWSPRLLPAPSSSKSWPLTDGHFKAKNLLRRPLEELVKIVENHTSSSEM